MRADRQTYIQTRLSPYFAHLNREQSITTRPRVSACLPPSRCMHKITNHYSYHTSRGHTLRLNKRYNLCRQCNSIIPIVHYNMYKNNLSYGKTVYTSGYAMWFTAAPKPIKYKFFGVTQPPRVAQSLYSSGHN